MHDMRISLLNDERWRTKIKDFDLFFSGDPSVILTGVHFVHMNPRSLDTDLSTFYVLKLCRKDQT